MRCICELLAFANCVAFVNCILFANCLLLRIAFICELPLWGGELPLSPSFRLLLNCMYNSYFFIVCVFYSDTAIQYQGKHLLLPVQPRTDSALAHLLPRLKFHLPPLTERLACRASPYPSTRATCSKIRIRAQPTSQAQGSSRSSSTII